MTEIQQGMEGPDENGYYRVWVIVDEKHIERSFRSRKVAEKWLTAWQKKTSE